MIFVARPWLVWLAIAIPIVTVVVLLLVRSRSGTERRSAAFRERLEVDALDPFKRWAQAVFMIVTGNCDFGHLPRAEAVRILSTWWSVHGPLEFSGTLDSLANPGRPDNAWDLVRFMLLARLGAAAGHIDDLTSWAKIRPIATRLQAAYPEWNAMGQAYLMARRQSRGLPLDGTQDDASTSAIRDNIEHLRQTSWRELQFRSGLADDDRG